MARGVVLVLALGYSTRAVTERSLRPLLVGLSVGVLLAYLQGDELLQLNIWKFGLGATATLLALSLVRRYASTILVLLAIAALDLVLGVRNLGLSASIAAVLFVTAQSGRKVLGQGITLVVFCLVILLPLASGLVLPSLLRAVGAPNDVVDKTEAQLSGDFGGLGGTRPEPFIGLELLKAEPLLGRGDRGASEGEVARAIASIEARGGQISAVVHKAGNPYPAHSHLVNDWLQAGLAGGLLWLVLGGRVAITLFRRLGTGTATGIQSVAGCMVLWDILFSPFGGVQRVMTPLLVALALVESKSDGEAG